MLTILHNMKFIIMTQSKQNLIQFKGNQINQISQQKKCLADAQIFPTKNKQENSSQKELSESSDSIDHYADDTPLPKAKPFDLKSLWLGQTNNMLQKFNNIYAEIKKQQKGIEEGFKMFAENENKYKLSSLRKININLDRKQLYNQYMAKTRQPIEKISPALIINILSYTGQHLFFSLFRMRKVSRIFNEIFLNEPIQMYMAQKDYLFSGEPASAMKASMGMCKQYVSFHKTFLYYKAMQYSQQIPQNSIMKDFEEAVNFINDIHKLVMEKHNRNFTYYQLMNKFMKKHRIVIGLSSLSLTSLVMVRKAAIIAFSNYLAFNRQERTKEQITKTKYSKAINVVEYEDYRDSLILNTKVSNYLWESYGQNFAVLVTNSVREKNEIVKVRSWNIVIYHKHNEQKAIYLEDVELQSGKFSSARLDLEFDEDMNKCKFSTIEYLNWVLMESEARLMDILISPLVPVHHMTSTQQHGDQEQFSCCYFYRLQQYYIIAIPRRFE